MRLSTRLLVIVGVVLMHLFVQPGPVARACVCAAPPETPLSFDGTALGRGGMSTMGAMHRFRVVRVERGAALGEVVEVALSVPEGSRSSSCDLAAEAPTVDATYRVTAYAGDANGVRTFFANQCGGSLELVHAASALSSATDTDDRSNSLLVGGTALATAAVATVLLRRRRTP